MAATPIKFPILKQTDVQLLRGFQKLFEESEVGVSNASVTLLHGVPAFELQAGFQVPEEYTEIVGRSSHAIQIVTVATNISSVSIRFERTDKYPASDQVTINYTPASVVDSAAALSLLVDRAKKELKSLARSPSTSPILTKELQVHFQRREAEIDALQGSLADFMDQLAKQTAETRRQLNEEQQDRLAAADEEIQRRRESLTAEMGEIREQLESDRESIKKREKELDDSAAKHARRAISKSLKDQLKARGQEFKLTEGTRQLRWRVTLFAILLCIVFGSGLLYYSNNLVQLLEKPNISTAIYIATIVRQLLVGLAFGATSIFLIRWQRKWFQTHADEEFRLKRLDIELDRASWIVETALDWTDQTGEPIPTSLLDRIGANLFSDEGGDTEALHPADQLASAIFGASSEATIKLPGGNELRLDRRAINRLKKEDGDT